MCDLRLLFLRCQNSLTKGIGPRSGSESGQAIIEYLLVVIVSVTLVVSIAMSIFRPLGNFIDNLNRQYVQCLLETGELPQLSSQEQNVICFEEFPTFATLDEDGNPMAPGEGGQLEERDARATRDGSTSGVSSAASGGRSGAGFASNVARSRRGRAGGETRPSKTVTIPVDQQFDEGSGFMRSGSSGGGYRIRKKKQQQIAVASMTDGDRRQMERNIERNQSRTVSNDEGFTSVRKRKVVVKPPLPKVVDEEIKVEVGFGKYFKIFFVIIFILFVIVVFGSQAMQISKNWGGD